MDFIKGDAGTAGTAGRGEGVELRLLLLVTPS